MSGPHSDPPWDAERGCDKMTARFRITSRSVAAAGFVVVTYLSAASEGATHNGGDGQPQENGVHERATVPGGNDVLPQLSAIRFAAMQVDSGGNLRGDEVLVYQNTLGEYFFHPGVGSRVADDLTPIGESCTLSKFVIRVSGRVDGGGGDFGVEVELYDDCPDPSVGGQLIPHTTRLVLGLPDDADVFHDLEFDFADRGICADQSECHVSAQDCADTSPCEPDPLILPPTVWLRMRFTTSSAGIVVGSPAQVGNSEDAYDDVFGDCTQHFGLWPAFAHASFWVEIYAEPGCTCESDAACADGVFCNGSEICGASGGCEPGPTPCARPDLCHEESQSCSCETDAHCDDDLYCNGMESCNESAACVTGAAPCAPGEVCDEEADECLCDSDDDCDDGLYCTGFESCDVATGACIAGDLPCARLDLCDDVTRECSCEIDDHCADGLFCNGAETCDQAGVCLPGTMPCPPNEVCDEMGDECLCDGNDDCDDGVFCNGTEICDAAGHCIPEYVADCNNNSTEDTCDIDQGTSQDCDGNAVPDDCQTDCDGDTIPDACEVPPFGDLPDCNGNLVPDNCDIAAFHDCCDARNETGCSNPDIEACVCDVDPFCCDTDWDRVCVEEVESLGCATCDVTRDCNVNAIPDECEFRGRLVGHIGFGGRPAMNFDVETGAVTPFSGMSTRGPGYLWGWAYDPLEDVLYASDHENDLIFAVNPDTGGSSIVCAVPFTDVRDLAFDPIARTLYGVAQDNDELFSVNPATGVLTTVGQLGFIDPRGLAFDVAGSVLIVSGSQSLYSPSLYSVDPVTGTESIIEMETPIGFAGLALDDATGSLYGLSGGNLYVIDLALGTHTLVDDANLYMNGLAFDSHRDTLFGAEYGQYHSRLVELDKETATRTPGAPLGYGWAVGLAFDATNTLFGLDSGLEMLFTIDQESGVGSSPVPLSSGRLDELAYDSLREGFLAENWDTDEIVSIDAVTGAVFPVAPLGLSVSAMSYDSSTDTLYASSANQLLGIDVATGAVWTVGFLGVEYVSGLAFDPVRNVLLGISSSLLLEIDPQTGATRVTGELPSSMNLSNLALDPTSGRLFSTHFSYIGTSGRQLVEIDREGGSVSFVGQVGHPPGSGWTFDASRNNIYSLYGGDLITIDPHTGEGTARRLNLGAYTSADVTFNPNTGTIVGAASRVIYIDPATGWGTETGLPFDTPPPSGAVEGVAYNPYTDTLVGVSNDYYTIWYTIDPATGTTEMIDYYDGINITSIAFSANGAVLYGICSEPGSDRLCGLSTGSVARLGTGEIGFDNITAIALDPNTNTLYGIDAVAGEYTLIDIDLSTAVGTAIGPVGHSVSGLAFDRNSNTLYGVDSSTGRLSIIDKTSGAGSYVGPMGYSLLGLAADPLDGMIFAAVRNLSWLVKLDPESGVVSEIGPFGFDRVKGLAFDHSSRTLYGAGWDTSTGGDKLMTVDTATGAATLIGPLDRRVEIQELVFDQDNGKLYGASYFEDFFEIDVNTGAVTFIGSKFPQRITGLAFLTRGAIDCNANFRPDSCELADNDCNGNGLPDECEGDADCNANGQRDFCDLALGLSLDCNGNLMPDDCELIDNDCNQNAIPDDCELRFNDCDGNGVLDECDPDEDDGGVTHRLRTRMLASDPMPGAEFGYVVAMDGNVAVVGAPGKGDRGPDSGAAYIYERDTDGVWHFVRKLVEEDAAPGNRFGESVAISGNRIIVGSPGGDNYGIPSGAAYIYERDWGGPNEWGMVAKLTAFDGDEGDAFGGHVAIDGDIAVVGARLAAYVFHRQGGNAHEWFLRNRLGLSYYCRSVDISHYNIIVGVGGLAYIYEYSEASSSWHWDATLYASDRQDDGFFGYAVSIDGDQAVVGAPHVYKITDESGAVYIYERDEGGAGEWGEVQRLTTIDEPASSFGSDVSISQGLAIVGARTSDAAGINSGAAFLYVRQSREWVLSNQLLGCDTTSQDDFGHAVALSANTVIIGAGGNAVGTDRIGSAYLFTTQCSNGVLDPGEQCDDGNIDSADGCSAGCAVEDGSACIGEPSFCDIDCNGNGIIDATEIAEGTSPDCNENAIPDDCETDCNHNQVPDDCDLGAGTSLDCQGNGIPDECEVDCNDNGIPDDCDLTSGTSEDCNVNSIPDECEPDCNRNGVTDSCDLTGGQSEDCNGNLVPDECDIEEGVSVDCQPNGVPDECEADCNTNDTPDDCDIDSGTSTDCNVNGTPDECEPDCNANEVADECDISTGSSLDCNANRIPDECDLAQQTSADCNDNSTPDECDIADGTSLDCQNNGTPDECDIANHVSADCNGNEIPDECDIWNGNSQDCQPNAIPDECEADCDLDGIPDVCELSDGTESDCNLNGVPDSCDIADGFSLDCQPNGLPDECDIGAYTESSGVMSPIGGTVPQQYTFVRPPPASGDVTLRFEATADLQFSYESVGIELNDIPVGRVFETGASRCAIPPDSESITLSAGTFNAIVAGRNAVVDMLPTTNVDATQCSPSRIEVTLEYALGEAGPDCNGNGIPDDCDIADGVSLDCNTNGIPDLCELSDGTVRDCNLNLLPDVCDIAKGVSADCQPNGIPDECDLGLRFTDSSDMLAPIDALFSQTHYIDNPPLARGMVTFTIYANADLSRSSEYFSVFLNGVPRGTVFTSGGVDCAEPPIADELAVTAAVFNEAVAGGTAQIQIIPSAGVDPGACADSWVSVMTSYNKLGGSTDCNQNELPDDCDEWNMDYDNNGSIDLLDYTYLLTCWGGPNLISETGDPLCATTCLQGFDEDGDDDVDLHDVGAFLRELAP